MLRRKEGEYKALKCAEFDRFQFAAAVELFTLTYDCHCYMLVILGAYAVKMFPFYEKKFRRNFIIYSPKNLDISAFVSDS